MSGAGNDQELDTYLMGGSVLSRIYRGLGVEQPSEATDRRILDAARGRGTGAPRERFSCFSPGWRISLATAAVLCLAVVMGLLLQDQAGMPVFERRPAPMDEGLPVFRRPAVDVPGPREEAAAPAPVVADKAVRSLGLEAVESEAEAAPTVEGREAAARLEDIRRLRARGEYAAAAAALVEFRRDYPDYPLPALRAALGINGIRP